MIRKYFVILLTSVFLLTHISPGYAQEKSVNQEAQNKIDFLKQQRSEINELKKIIFAYKEGQINLTEEEKGELKEIIMVKLDEIFQELNKPENQQFIREAQKVISNLPENIAKPMNDIFEIAKLNVNSEEKLEILFNYSCFFLQLITTGIYYIFYSLYLSTGGTIFFILLLVAFVIDMDLFICAIGPPPVTTTTTVIPITILNHVITNNPDPNHNNYCDDYPASIANFSTNDVIVYSWLQYENGTINSPIEWQFWGPDSSLYETSNLNIQYTNGCAWGGIYINNYPPENMTGNWHVDVYYKGINQFTDTFTITSPATFTSIHSLPLQAAQQLLP